MKPENKINSNFFDLAHTTDALIWAKKWSKTIKENPEIPHDEDTMIGWFANAIMAGFDDGFVKGATGALQTLNKQPKTPRKLSWVKFIPDDSLKECYTNNHPLKTYINYIFLGEIPNMPGHCIILDPMLNKIYSGVHTNNFTELSENEI